MTQIAFAGGQVPVSSIYCIGRNYPAHAAEMGSVVEDDPMVFLKPRTAILPPGRPIVLPGFSGDVHHEAEIVLLIGKGGTGLDEATALSHVAGIGIGIDLTARDVQAGLKKKGHPWTLAKGFLGSAVVSDFVPAPDLSRPLVFHLSVNGTRRQTGDSSRMAFGFARLLAYISSVYGLAEGDLVYTGTPEGVGPLQAGDRVALVLEGLTGGEWQVTR